jgi:hypothetical protein
MSCKCFFFPSLVFEKLLPSGLGKGGLFENRMLTGKWEEGNGYTVKIVMNRNISVCVFRKLILKVQYCIYLDIPFFTL